MLRVLPEKGKTRVTERPVVWEVITEPEGPVSREQFRRNWAWYDAHRAEVCTEDTRGLYFCVAGQQLFLAETPAEANRLAEAAHPEDRGRYHGRVFGDDVLHVQVVPRSEGP